MRARVVAEAQAWLNTPYRHQTSLKGVGCDCIGLVRGVWRALYGAEPLALPPYSPDWAETGGREALLDGLSAHVLPIGLNEARPGDVIAFRMRPRAVAKHVAILSAGEGLDDPHARIIHAYWGHAVVSSWLGPYWRRHAVAAFSFPPGLAPVGCKASSLEHSVAHVPKSTLRDGSQEPILFASPERPRV